MTTIQNIQRTNEAIIVNAKNKNIIFSIDLLDYRFKVLKRLNKLTGLVLENKTRANVNKIQKLVGEIYSDFVICNFIERGDFDYSLEVALKTYSLKPTDKEDLICSLLSVCQSINTTIGVNKEEPKIFSRYDYTTRAIDTLLRICQVYNLDFKEVILGD